MIFPIKYIENNMVKNIHDEWYAYYRIEPYNYSFCSLDEKVQIYNRLRQLIGQTRMGNIHLLDIGTEKSVRKAQKRSEGCAIGSLADIAKSKIDLQTKVLVDGEQLEEPENEDDIPFYTGETQVDYQFYIGFKLMPTEDASVKGRLAETMTFWRDYVSGINKNLMGDYATVDDAEFERYSRIEHLMCSKISRLFTVHRVQPNEVGYIVEHLYGNTGTPYEEYKYHLPKEKYEDNVRVKCYDFLKLSNAYITEHPRYMTLEQENEKMYCAYLTVSDIVGELSFPGCEMLYYQQEEFGFPVDTSINVEVIGNKKAMSTLRNKDKELNDLADHAYKTGNKVVGAVDEALETVDELLTDLSATKDAMYKMSYIVRVTAPTKAELDRRCNSVIDYYDDFSIKLVRPVGDMMGFHTEFIPSARRYNSIVTHVQSDYLACLGFGASQIIGDKEGIPIGHTKYSQIFFYLKTWLAAQGISGSVTNSLSCAFIGSLGGGKSFLNNLLIYYSVLFGAKAVIVDPKSERGGWKETLPEIAHEISIINLTSEEENRGILDPFLIMGTVKEAETLAMEVLTFLTGVTIQDNDRYPVLRNAVRAVTQRENRGLLMVIDELRKDDSPVAKSLASHLDGFADFGLAHLLFSDGSVKNTIGFEKRLNIIQIADLVMPDSKAKVEDYSTEEMLSVAMLVVISTFCLDFIHSDRSIFKIVNLDEAWSVLNVSQGSSLANKLTREGRAMNAGVYFCTQNAKDLLDERIKNNIGMFFIFKSNDLTEIKNSLMLLGVDPEDENNQEMIRGLRNGQCVMKDIYGRVNVVKIDYLLPELKHAFDTRPPMQKE